MANPVINPRVAELRIRITAARENAAKKQSENRLVGVSPSQFSNVTVIHGTHEFWRGFYSALAMYGDEWLELIANGDLKVVDKP